jgi:hypothetical protein
MERVLVNHLENGLVQVNMTIDRRKITALRNALSHWKTGPSEDLLALLEKELGDINGPG